MPLNFFSSPAARTRGLAGWRAYVIGDVHGCLTELDDLLKRIIADHEGRPRAKGLIVLLGDLIDRGPASAEVIELLATVKLPGFRIVSIAGNHEEVLQRILEGDTSRIEGWLRFGGTETLRSYSADAEQIALQNPREAQASIAAAIPASHRDFLLGLADSLRFGDYLFVHAGIRPGVPLEQQSLTDLRWIREPFLSDRRDHGAMVVHGHTISERVEQSGWRIGIDTGAYASGRLSALCLEDERRWLIDTVDGYRDWESVNV